MKKALKWLGIVLGGLIGLVIVAVVVLLFIGGSRADRSYSIQEETVAIPSDAAAIQRGQHLTEAVVGCTGCHGTNLGGYKMFEDPMIGVVYGPNLTSGQGGIVSSYRDSDWVRAIRHGVSPSGKGLLIMPVEEFHNLSPEDLGAIIAYLKTLPPVDNHVPKPDLRPMGRILVAVGAFGEIVPAQLVDYSAPHPAPVSPAVNVEYGRYLVSIAGCTGCHGKDLSGGQPPEPGSPLAPNLTPGDNLGGWSEEVFIAAIRNGQSTFMPYESFAKMTNDELGAVWRYLQSLPAKESMSP